MISAHVILASSLIFEVPTPYGFGFKFEQKYGKKSSEIVTSSFCSLCFYNINACYLIFADMDIGKGKLWKGKSHLDFCKGKGKQRTLIVILLLQEAISAFYRFIWNLFYAEYIIFPFI